MKRIAIHSVPRSGSTWLGEIFNSVPITCYKYQPLFSYSFKGRLSPNTSEKGILGFFEELCLTKDDFLDLKEQREKGTSPIFNKDNSPKFIVYKEVRYHHILPNLLAKDKMIKVIGLVRNPLSTINSWLQAPREFRKDLGWVDLEEWRWAKKKNLDKPEEFNGYEKWKETTRLFEQLKEQYPKHFFLLNYNDLLVGAEKTVKELFDFCGLDYTEQTRKFIQDSSSTDQSNDAYSVFRIKQKDDKWKNQLDHRIIKAIQSDLINSDLAKYIL